MDSKYTTTYDNSSLLINKDSDLQNSSFESTKNGNIFYTSSLSTVGEFLSSKDANISMDNLPLLNTDYLETKTSNELNISNDVLNQTFEFISQKVSNDVNHNDIISLSPEFISNYEDTIFISQSIVVNSEYIQDKIGDIHVSQSVVPTSEYLTTYEYNLNRSDYQTVTGEFSQPHESTITEISSRYLGKQYPWQDEYGNEYQYTVFQDTLSPQIRNSGSNGDYNVGYYEKSYLFYAIGDVELVSASKNPNNQVDPIEVDYENPNTFRNKLIIKNKSYENYVYDTYWKVSGSTSFTNPKSGRPMGRTAYFVTKSNGDIVYPVNHYINVGTSKQSLRHLFYEGTQLTGSSPFQNRKDVKPNQAFYSVNVGGSDTDQVLKVVRRK